MNKVFNVNLGEYPFTIDEDAYLHLDNYLSTIHNHFRSSEGYEEITSDIEIRLAELFLDSMGSRKIVNMKDVKAAIQTMGTPEEFGAEPVDETFEEAPKHEHSFRPGKRLYRNPDETIVAGVASGIAAYLGIQDPLWVRLALVLLTTFSFGTFMMAYFILWAIVPEAKTAGDRLAMRGEPINVSNIGKIIEEEVHMLSDKMNEFGEEFKSKKKASPKTTELEIPLRKGFIF